MENKIKSPWPGPEGLIPVTNGKAEDANKIKGRPQQGAHQRLRV